MFDLHTVTRDDLNGLPLEEHQTLYEALTGKTTTASSAPRLRLQRYEIWAEIVRRREAGEPMPGEPAPAPEPEPEVKTLTVKGKTYGLFPWTLKSGQAVEVAIEIGPDGQPFKVCPGDGLTYVGARHVIESFGVRAGKDYYRVQGQTVAHRRALTSASQREKRRS